MGPAHPGCYSGCHSGDYGIARPGNIEDVAGLGWNEKGWLVAGKERHAFRAASNQKPVDLQILDELPAGIHKSFFGNKVFAGNQFKLRRVGGDAGCPVVSGPVSASGVYQGWQELLPSACDDG